MANGLPTFQINTKPLTGQAFFQPPTAIRPRGQEQAEAAIEQQELLEEQERQLEGQRLQQEIENRRQQLLAQQTARGITGGLAAAQQQELEERAGLALDEKTQRDLLEKEFARREKRQSLRQAFAAQMLKEAERKHRINYNEFQRAFSRFRQTTAGKMIEEQEAAKNRLQNEYDYAVASLQKSTSRRKAATAITGAVAGLMGTILAPFTGGASLVAAGAITSLAGGISAGVGRRRASEQISRFRRR